MILLENPYSLCLHLCIFNLHVFPDECHYKSWTLKFDGSGVAIKSKQHFPQETAEVVNHSEPLFL